MIFLISFGHSLFTEQYAYADVFYKTSNRFFSLILCNVNLRKAFRNMNMFIIINNDKYV